MTLFDPQPLPKSVDGSPNHVPCSRCGIPCVVRGKPGSEAQLFKFATKPKGVCVSCAVKYFCRNAGILEHVFAQFENCTPDAFKLPHVQEIFRSVMKIGKADASFDEIDWDRVAKNWGLPL